MAEIKASRTSVFIVARRYDINATLLFRRRDDPRYSTQAESFLPIEINVSLEVIVAPSTDLTELGIWIVGDVPFVIKGSFDLVALGTLNSFIRNRHHNAGSTHQMPASGAWRA